MGMWPYRKKNASPEAGFKIKKTHVTSSSLPTPSPSYLRLKKLALSFLVMPPCLPAATMLSPSWTLALWNHRPALVSCLHRGVLSPQQKSKAYLPTDKMRVGSPRSHINTIMQTSPDSIIHWRNNWGQKYSILHPTSYAGRGKAHVEWMSDWPMHAWSMVEWGMHPGLAHHAASMQVQPHCRVCSVSLGHITAAHKSVGAWSWTPGQIATANFLPSLGPSYLNYDSHIS